MSAPRTLVIFRVWRAAPHDVIALMPELLEERGHCTSYQHIGQHGAADYSSCIARTRPATRAEYLPLKRELERCGYRFRVGRRWVRPRARRQA